jgi:uncharacterized membrane protein YphA (DoxX/SURF4 family)
LDAVLSRRKDLFLFVARLALGGVFVYAGLEKILSPREFARVVVNYRILPDWAAVYFGFLLPWIELVLGALLVAGIFVRQAAVGLSFLVVVFMIALTIKAASGGLKECGCFLSAVKAGAHGLGYYLGRDVILLALGGFNAVKGKGLVRFGKALVE